MRCLRTERNVDKGENIYGLTNNTLELNLINRNKDAIYTKADWISTYERVELFNGSKKKKAKI